MVQDWTGTGMKVMPASPLRAAGVTNLQISPAGHDRLGDIEKVKSWIS